MTLLVTAALIVVGASLGVAGLSKVFDRSGSIAGAASLGVPAVAAPIVGAALAPIELALAFLLFVEATSRAAAGGAAVLFGVFTLALIVNLARGRRPRCHCFGAISSAPISVWSVIRNLGLIAACLVLLARGPSDHAVVAVTVAAALAVGTFYRDRREA